MKETKNMQKTIFNKFTSVIKIFAIFIKTFIITTFVFTFCAGLFISYKVKPIYDELERTAKIEIGRSDYTDFRVNEATYIYNTNGDIIVSLTPNGKSTYLKSEEIPNYVKQAFVAVEDRNFYEHNGFDLKGIIRVCLQYVKTSGDEKHGASTITQQVIKNIFLSSEVTIERKIKEIFYAIELEKKYTKDEILEFYINAIFYGNQCYGIQSASEGYFGKPVNELTLSQIAYLCAIPNSPTYYDPFKYPDHTIERRNKILNDMYECGFISEKELNEALSEEIILSPGTNNKITFQNYETTYAIECATRYFMQCDGFKFEYSWETMQDYKNYEKRYNESFEKNKEELCSGSYHIYTTIDPEAQKTIQEVLNSTLSFSDELQDDGTYALQGAVTCIDNTTGKVVAIVGGRTQDSNNIYTLNRAYQSYRQPGSSIKPIAIYAPALEKGYTKKTALYDIDVKAAYEKDAVIDEMTGNIIQLGSAVERSKNGAAIYLFNKIGVKYGLSFLQNMNFKKIIPDDYNISAGLGGLTLGTTTEEMASAYFTLANHGNYIEPTCIYSILDKKGKEIYKDPASKEVYSDNAADDITNILKGVITNGTASSMYWYSKTKTEAAGKTGTTNNSKDGWFCGYTPYYTMAVWIGYDTPKSLNSLKGSSYPATIWKESMLNLIADKETKSFEKSEFYEEKPIVYHGNATIILPESAYYKYMQGRDDSEEIVEGYTVYDYRVDRTIGESVFAVINQINALDKTSPTFEQDIATLYSNGTSTIATIYSRSYAEEITLQLNNAYITKIQ